MLDLDAIEARAEAATPGPWMEPRNGLGLGWTIFPKNSKGWSIATCDSGTDADFIAASRTDVPALVAELRAAREVVEAAVDLAERDGHKDDLCDDCGLSFAFHSLSSL